MTVNNIFKRFRKMTDTNDTVHELIMVVSFALFGGILMVF